MPHCLETLSHPRGAIVVGWLARRVMYVRLLETLPGPLAIRFAFHLGRLLQTEEGVRYFADASELEAYEPRSSTILREFFAVHRHRFASIDIATPPGLMELTLCNFSSIIGGGLVQIMTISELHTRLARAAPRCEEGLNPRTWRTVPPVSMPPPSR